MYSTTGWQSDACNCAFPLQTPATCNHDIWQPAEGTIARSHQCHPFKGKPHAKPLVASLRDEQNNIDNYTLFQKQCSQQHCKDRQRNCWLLHFPLELVLPLASKTPGSVSRGSPSRKCPALRPRLLLLPLEIRQMQCSHHTLHTTGLSGFRSAKVNNFISGL